MTPIEFIAGLIQWGFSIFGFVKFYLWLISDPKRDDLLYKNRMTEEAIHNLFEDVEENIRHTPIRPIITDITSKTHAKRRNKNIQ